MSTGELFSAITKSCLKRKSAKLTQTEIAEAMKTKFSNVSALETFRIVTPGMVCRYVWAVNRLINDRSKNS